MTSRNVTQADLAQAVAYALGLPKHEAIVLAEQVLTEICDTLDRGENVKLSGFGNFSVRDKAERMGRNPKTGEAVPIEPRRVVTFTPSNNLRGYVNGSVALTGQATGYSTCRTRPARYGLYLTKLTQQSPKSWGLVRRKTASGRT
jgi:integration host factor subunit alpha